jgi:hypothetical protein
VPNRALNRTAQKRRFALLLGALRAFQVEFFLYSCGSADIIYVFPRVNFEFFVKTASLGGQKQVPNFTLYADANQFEPAGHSDTRFDISGFRNAFFLVPGAK